MEANKEDYYEFKRTLFYSREEKRQVRRDKLKEKVGHYLAAHKYFRRFLDPVTIYNFQPAKEKYRSSEEQLRAFKDYEPKEEKAYQDIKAKQISFIEVLELDKFDKTAERRFKKHRAKRFWFDSESSRLDFAEKISKIRSSFGQISVYPNFFFVDLTKSTEEQTNLIGAVSGTLQKTSESYIVLRFDVTPSAYFLQLFAKIIEQKDASFYINNYRSWWNILRSRKLTYSQTGITSLKQHSLKNLYSELNLQVQEAFIAKFDGVFYNSPMVQELPTIRSLEVGNISDAKLETSLRGFLFPKRWLQFNNRTAGDLLFLEDQSINEATIMLTSGLKSGTEREIQRDDMRRQISHQALLTSVSFIIAMNKTLHLGGQAQKELKREVYDFVAGRSNHFLKQLKPLYFRNRKYLYLKLKLAKMIMTNKRHENELVRTAGKWFFNDASLHEYQAVDEQDKKTPLPSYVNNKTTKLVQSMKDELSDINEVFVPIEELNSYRTNLYQQRFALVLGVVAFIFAFDEIKGFFKAIFDWLGTSF